jgi:cytochrome c oxidase cbb3-type subunit 3
MNESKNPTRAPDTGHVWDSNLRELTNQPPRWWMITLYLSAAFVAIYVILYPAIPLVSGYTTGILGWTQMKRLNDSVADIEAVRAPYENRLKGMTPAAILADDDLTSYTVRSAKVLFGDRCAPCHGAGGAGNPGFPVLADDDWLFGGDIDTLVQSITGGREGMMPGFGAMISAQQIDTLTQHVLVLSRGESGTADGQALFVEQGCASCHGMDAKGMTVLGSANLSDGIWRFTPGSEESIKYTIAHGVNDPGLRETRNAIMPAFGEQLSETDIKKLAVYVYKLGK